MTLPASVTSIIRAWLKGQRRTPYFAAMESPLTPGEYAISMRNLKSSLESHWKARSFNQPEPTHLPTDLVQILLVGPYHQNRPAYEAMREAILKIDPAFRLPTP